MMLSRLRSHAFCVGLIAVGIPVFAQTAPKLPIEAFGMLPVAQRASLSPDGQKVAMLANNAGTSAIVVREIGKPDGKTAVVMNSNNRDFTFKWFRWVGSDRLVVAVLFPAKRRHGSSSVGGVETYESRLLSVKADGTQNINLIKPNTFKGELQAQFQDDVIDFDVDGGKHILLALSDPFDSMYPAVYSLDTETGARNTLMKPREFFRTWMTDRNHQVRIGVRIEKGDVEIHACDPDGSNWRKLWSYKLVGGESVYPMGFGKDPNQLYIMGEHEGRNALMTVDLRDPALKRTVKLASTTNDISGSLVYSKTTGEPIGIVSADTFVQSEISYWDADRRALTTSVNEALPGRYNRILSTSEDETKYLVYSSSDKAAGEIYLGNHSTNSLGLFVGTYPQLPEQYLVPKKAITVKARDGMELPGYISTPLGVKASKLPTVLLVNGGPQGRADGSFNVLAQFLTNRGYAVLQINARGSSGFGTKFRDAGLQQWGQEMQNDLNDGLNWAVAEGITDPKRVCIVGANYGGYAALMGVAKTPEAFKCAVSFAGVTDLVAMSGDRGQYMSGKEVFEAAVGSDTERLRQNSPRYLAKQIKSPVLLFHGTEDRNVSIYQGEYMDTALTEASVPHKFVKQVRGDHYLSIYEHKMQFYTELDAFLAANLGATAVQ